MKLILPYIVLVSIVLLLAAGFFFVKDKGVKGLSPKEQAEKVDLSYGCRLALDQKYFPVVVGDYKFGEVNRTETGIGASYKNEKGKRLAISIVGQETFFGTNNKSEQNIYNQNRALKVMKGEASQEELVANSVYGSSKYEVVGGTKLLVADVIAGKERIGENLWPLTLTYYDKKSDLFLFMSFEEKDNYGAYYEQWASQVC